MGGVGVRRGGVVGGLVGVAVGEGFAVSAGVVGVGGEESVSGIRRGDPTWRLHDSLVDSGGCRWLIFRRWGEEDDAWVRASVFGYDEGNDK